MSSVGSLGRDHLDQDPGPHDHLHDRVAAVPRAEAQDLVADGRDHRDQQDPAAATMTSGALPADEAEREDRQRDDDDQELRAAARVGRRVLADRLDVSGSSCLERVDRHVLGAVVLEDAPDVGHLRRSAPGSRGRSPTRTRPSTRCWTQSVLDVRGRDARDEQRQQEEDADAERRASARASARSSPCRARRRPRSAWMFALRTSQRVPTTSVSYRTTRPRTNGSFDQRCRGRPRRAARWPRRCGRRDGARRPRSRRGRASGRPR